MAKKQTVDTDLFAQTEAPSAPVDVDQPDPVKAYGVGLKISEWGKIESIAKLLGIKRHEVAVWAIRDFLRRWDKGEIQTKTKQTLPGQQ
jgi:hypothetical protein